MFKKINILQLICPVVYVRLGEMEHLNADTMYTVRYPVHKCIARHSSWTT